MHKMHPDSMKLMRIGGYIDLIILFVVLGVIYFVEFMGWIPVSKYVYIVLGGIGLIYGLLDIFFFPKLKYDTSLYELNDEEIITMNGIWNKEKKIIPYVTIQNVETQQGPIMKRYDIKSLEVMTAENALSIAYIHQDEAEELKHLINDKMRQIDKGKRHD